LLDLGTLVPAKLHVHKSLQQYYFQQITKRLNPLALRHKLTGSGIVMTWGMLLKWFSSVVLPLPMFPSTITVKGRAGFMFKELMVLAETVGWNLVMILIKKPLFYKAIDHS
jgi:hypothetical protein